MKFKEELANEKNPATIRIGEYLAKRAETDPSVAINLGKENKSLAECYGYVRNEARKQAINGCACIDDETVFGWAVHYYDEDDIKVDDDVMTTKSKHKTTEETSKKATDNISGVSEPQKKKKAPNTRKKEKEPLEGQMSLF